MQIKLNIGYQISSIYTVHFSQIIFTFVDDDTGLLQLLIHLCVYRVKIKKRFDKNLMDTVEGLNLFN